MSIALIGLAAIAGYCLFVLASPAGPAGAATASGSSAARAATAARSGLGRAGRAGAAEWLAGPAPPSCTGCSGSWPATGSAHACSSATLTCWNPGKRQDDDPSPQAHPPARVGKTVAVRQHHREVRVTTVEDTSWWDHAGEEPVQGSPDDPEGTTYFRQGDGVLCAVHPDGTVHEVDEDESAPLTTGPEYADDPDGASVIQADGLTIGGAYACSYNPAQQVGWGHDDGGLSGESWASWGPRGAFLRPPGPRGGAPGPDPRVGFGDA